MHETCGSLWLWFEFLFSKPWVAEFGMGPKNKKTKKGDTVCVCVCVCMCMCVCACTCVHMFVFAHVCVCVCVCVCVLRAGGLQRYMQEMVDVSSKFKPMLFPVSLFHQSL